MSNAATLWTALPAAAEILDDLSRNPPEQRHFKDRFSDNHIVYTGAAVRQLRAIYRAEQDRLLAEGDRTGDHTAFRAHCALTVDEAIEQLFTADEQQWAEAAE